MAMHTRRKKHPKSQTGCSFCKRRHVKCDELMPCSACRRRGDHCDLGKSAVGVKRCTTCGTKEDPLEWTREIYLMHHFTADTSTSLVLHDSTVTFAWKYVVPGLALENPFLMHAILALSSLHLAYLRPKEEARWTQSALEHQNKAIIAIQPIITNLTKQSDQNLHALFAAAISLACSSLVDTKFTTLRQSEGPAAISDIISCVLHTRGIGRVCDLSGTLIHTGPLGHLVVTSIEDKIPPLATLNGITVAEFTTQWRLMFEGRQITLAKSQFARIRDMLECELQPSVLSHMEEALLLLELLYAELEYRAAQEPKHWYPGLVWKWTIMLPHKYVTLLQAKHPAALVIYAHFTILSLLFDEWYLDGYSMRAMASISAELCEPWSELMDWSKEQLRNGLRDICGTSDRFRKEYGEEVD